MTEYAASVGTPLISGLSGGGASLLGTLSGGGTSPAPKQLGQTVEVTQDKFTDNVIGSAVPIVIGTAPVPGMIVLGSEVIVTTVYSGTVDPAENVGGSGGDQGGGGVTTTSSSGSSGGGGDFPPDGPFEWTLKLRAQLTVTSLGGSCGTPLIHASNAYTSRLAIQRTYLDVSPVDGADYPMEPGGIVVMCRLSTNGWSTSVSQSVSGSYYLGLVDISGVPVYTPEYVSAPSGTSVGVNITNGQTLDGSPMCRGFGALNAGYFSEIGSGDSVLLTGPVIDFGGLTFTRLDNGTVYHVTGVSSADYGGPGDSAFYSIVSVMFSP